jgi:hypothetical protein
MEYRSICNMKRLTSRSEPANLIVVEGHDRPGSEPPPAPRPTAKKPYQPPKVTEYGNVARLTAGTNGSNWDPGKGTGTKLGRG